MLDSYTATMIQHQRYQMLNGTKFYLNHIVSVHSCFSVFMSRKLGRLPNRNQQKIIEKIHIVSIVNELKELVP